MLKNKNKRWKMGVERYVCECKSGINEYVWLIVKYFRVFDLWLFFDDCLVW